MRGRGGRGEIEVSVVVGTTVPFIDFSSTSAMILSSASSWLIRIERSYKSDLDTSKGRSDGEASPSASKGDDQLCDFLDEFDAGWRQSAQAVIYTYHLWIHYPKSYIP